MELKEEIKCWEVTKHIRVSGKESFICVGGTSMTSFGA